MDDDRIADRLHTLGDSLFPATFSAYLRDEHKVLWGIRIEGEHPSRFVGLFGPISESDMALLNEHRASSSAGYCANAKELFPNLTTNADIFLLNDKVLSRSPREIEAFVLHELAHWYFDSGCAHSHPLPITDEDRTAGDAMYNNIDLSARDWEDQTRHTPDFCVTLSHLARTAEQHVLPGSGSLIDLVMADDIRL
jgi:hypothetical protein